MERKKVELVPLSQDHVNTLAELVKKRKQVMETFGGSKCSYKTKHKLTEAAKQIPGSSTHQNVQFRVILVDGNVCGLSYLSRIIDNSTDTSRSFKSAAFIRFWLLSDAVCEEVLDTMLSFYVGRNADVPYVINVLHLRIPIACMNKPAYTALQAAAQRLGASRMLHGRAFTSKTYSVYWQK